MTETTAAVLAEVNNRHDTALIDVEAVGRGTRLHDVTTLLLYAALWGEDDVHDRLTAGCRGIADPGAFEISLSAVALGLLASAYETGPTTTSTPLAEQPAEPSRGSSRPDLAVRTSPW